MATSAYTTPLRLPWLDAVRGLAMVWMTVFHFCFDLQHFGWLRANFYADPFWTWQRCAIVSLFLWCAGMGQALALQQDLGWVRFLRRWAQIAACALLVSIGSWLMFGPRFIYFGILHGMAVMLLLARLTAGWGRWLWPLGALAIALPASASALHSIWPSLEALNTTPLNVLGLITRKPATEDYAPLLPWLGVMWWGMASGHWLIRRKAGMTARLLKHQALRVLATMGRWSLSYYMLHQLVLMGLLSGLQMWMQGLSRA
jgi:uncharacterized membrane protein